MHKVHEEPDPKADLSELGQGPGTSWLEREDDPDEKAEQAD